MNFLFFPKKEGGGSKKNFVNGIHFLFSYPFRYSEGGLDGYDNTWFNKKLQSGNCVKKFLPRNKSSFDAKRLRRERERDCKKKNIKEGGHSCCSRFVSAPAPWCIGAVYFLRARHAGCRLT